MTEYRIHCRVTDSHGIIQSVGIGDDKFSVEQVWQWIDEDKHNFFTLENNVRAKVRQGTSPVGNHYITTDPDGVTENNLDELSECV